MTCTGAVWALYLVREGVTSMRFKVRCTKCGHTVHTAYYRNRFLVHSCLNCHRVMIVGGPDGGAVGDMFDAQMKARGYDRTL